MSMLFYVLITALLIGIQAEPLAESNVPVGLDIPQAHWSKLQHSLDTALRRVRSAPAGTIAARVAGQSGNITVDPKLFKKRRLHSPRVLFSTQPPPLAADTQDLDLEISNIGPSNRTHRSKRSSHPIHQRGEYSVCDSVSVWVGDKTTATDIKGNEEERAGWHGAQALLAVFLLSTHTQAVSIRINLQAACLLSMVSALTKV